MKLIAHRGNLYGPDPAIENSPFAIDQALAQGFDVEADLRLEGEALCLGHDRADYVVSWYWLAKRADRLWLHCKNLEALHCLASKAPSFNYFWHEQDQYALTSKGFIWTCLDDGLTSRSVIVMPERMMQWTDIQGLHATNCYGMCSDFVALHA